MMPDILRTNRQLCHLNAGDRDSDRWRTFPVGGRDVLKPEDIAIGKICEDIVR